MAKIAFLGLGKMGAGMAARLLAQGHELSVFNRTASRAAAFSTAGARIARSPADACAGAAFVCSMVSDDAASQSMWLGEQGALSAARNALAIECSTLSHEWVLKLAGLANDCGLRYLDAPVTGLPDAAAAGTLTLLVGGDAADLETARPVLSAVSNHLIHFGPVGAGTAYKLIINLLGAVQIASAAESLAMAERAGLDLRVVVEAMSASQAASPQVVRNIQRMLANDHDRNVVFTPVLRLKDVDYALNLARMIGINVPFGELSAQSFRELIDAGGADLNESKVIDIARRR